MASWKHEMRMWSAIAVPAALRSAIETLPWVVSLAFMGRVDTEMLAAVSLYESLMFGFAPIAWSATANAASTLVSQCHGARNYAHAAGYGAMAFVASLGLCVPVAAIWVTSPRILAAAGFDQHLLDLGYYYPLIGVASLFLLTIPYSAGAYLQACQHALAPLLASGVECAADISLTYAFIFLLTVIRPYSVAYVCGWVAGEGLSAVVFVVMLLSINTRTVPAGDAEAEMIVPVKQLQDGPHAVSVPLLLEIESDNDIIPEHSRDFSVTSVNSERDRAAAAPVTARTIVAFLCSARHWRVFLEQAWPNVITVALETWQLQVIGLLAGRLNAADLAAHNSTIALVEFATVVLTGASEATSVRVGYHLGRGDVAAARLTTRLSLCLAVAVGLCISALLFGLRYQLPRLFSSDPQVIDTMAGIMLLASPAFAVLCCGMICLGVLEGQGRAQAPMVAFLVGCWCVGVPAAFGTFFGTHLGITGLWLSLVAGYATMCALSLVAVWRSDWQRLVQQAAERAAEGDGEGEAAAEKEQADEEEQGSGAVLLAG